MPTPKQLYVRKLAEITRRYSSLESETLARLVEMLKALQAQIAAELLGSSGWDAYRLRQQSANLERLVSSFESQLIRATSVGIEQAAKLGAASVVQPLQAAGIAGVFLQPTPAQVNVLLDFSADLIKGLAAETLQQLNRTLRLAALGNRSPYQAMQDITKALGLAKKPGGVVYRAETIVRTELQRTYNLANYSQMQATTGQVPELQKRWNATGDRRTRLDHLKAHGQTVPISQHFIVGGARLMYPLDPAGPAEQTINCRCRMTTIHPAIGVVGTPLDARIGKELKRRGESTYALLWT